MVVIKEEPGENGRAKEFARELSGQRLLLAITVLRGAKHVNLHHFASYTSMPRYPLVPLRIRVFYIPPFNEVERVVKQPRATP